MGLAGVGKVALEVVKLVVVENEVVVEAVGWVGVESGVVEVVVRQVLEVGDLVGEEVGMNEVAEAVGVKGLVVGVKVEVMEGARKGVMGVEMGVEMVEGGMEEVVVRGTSHSFDDSWICMQARPETRVTCMCVQSSCIINDDWRRITI